jgi:hypothetical protein
MDVFCFDWQLEEAAELTLYVRAQTTIERLVA